MAFTAVDLASGVMQKVRNGFAQTRDEAGKFGKRSADAFRQFGIGAATLTAGVAGLAVLGAATAKSTEFGYQIGRIRTVIDEASLSTQAAKDATLGLAASYGISAMQQADALYETISAGVTDAAKATELLDVANQFAVGGTTGLAGSVDVLTSAVNTYADQGLTAQKASDLMFTAIAAGKTTAEQLAQSLGEVAPTAHAAGVGFDELQAAIAALTVQGIKTPQAVSGLNAMLANIMKPASDAAAEATRLGIEFNATALKTKGLAGVLGQLAGNTKVNDNTFTKLFGSIDGIKSALTLTAGGGAKFNEVLAQMANATGATGKAFEIMSNTTRFQEQRFTSLFENAQILIGEALEPLKVGVLKVVNAVVEGFAKVPKPLRDFAVKAFATASAVLALLGAGLMLKAGIAILGAALTTFGVGTLGSLAAMFAPVVAAIALASLVVAAFRLAVKNNLGGLGAFFGKTGESISTFFRAFGQLVSGGTLDAGLTKKFRSGQDGATAFAVKLFMLVERIQNFATGIGKGFEEGLKAAEPAFAALRVSLEGLGKALGLTGGDVKDMGEEFRTAGGIGEGIGGTLARVVEGVAEALRVAVDFARGFAEAWGKIRESTAGLADALSKVGEAIVQVADDLNLGAGKVEGSAATWGKAMAGFAAGVTGEATTAVRDISSVIKALGPIVTGTVEIVAGVALGKWKTVWDGMRSIVAGVVSGIIDLTARMIGQLAKAIDLAGKLAGKDFGMEKKLGHEAELMQVAAREALGFKTLGETAGGGVSGPGLDVRMAVPTGSATMPAAAEAAAGAGRVAARMGEVAALAEAVRNAVMGLPPATVTVAMNLDGAKMGEALAKIGASAASRAGGAVAVDQG